VSACTERDILVTERRNLAVTETGLRHHEQKRPVTPPDPCVRIGCSDKSGSLFLSQKLHWTALITLRRDRQYALAMQGQCRFTDCYVLKECVKGGKTVVPSPRTVASLQFEVIEEPRQKRSIQLFYAKFGGRAFEALRGELEQQAEGVSVGCDGVRTCTQLLVQSVREETLNEGLKD